MFFKPAISPLGGERAYKGRLGNGRNPRHSRHSIATKQASQDYALMREHGSKAATCGLGYAVNVKVLPVPQSTSFSGISRLAKSMKFCPLQCMGITCSRSNFFSSAITLAR
jgi:hypothetical protein